MFNWSFCNLIGHNRFSVILHKSLMLGTLRVLPRGCGYARLELAMVCVVPSWPWCNDVRSQRRGLRCLAHVEAYDCICASLLLTCVDLELPVGEAHAGATVEHGDRTPDRQTALLYSPSSRGRGALEDEAYGVSLMLRLMTVSHVSACPFVYFSFGFPMRALAIASRNDVTFTSVWQKAARPSYTENGCAAVV